MVCTSKPFGQNSLCCTYIIQIMASGADEALEHAGSVLSGNKYFLNLHFYILLQ